MYNAYYRTVGFHQLVAFDGLTCDFSKVKLRPENVYMSNGVVEFIPPLIKHYNKLFLEASFLILGDSGFAMPDLFDLCESKSMFYIIGLKPNTKLHALAEELHPTDTIRDVSVMEHYV